MTMSSMSHLSVRSATLWLLAVGALLAACTAAPSAPAKPAAPTVEASRPMAAPQASAAPTAAPTVATASPPPRVALKVAVQGRPDMAHLQLAMDRGYLAAQGLDIETVQITSGAEMVPALATNQVQVGNGAPSAALFNALARGVDIRLVADYAHVGPPTDTTLAMMVRKEAWDSGAVRSLADMRGRTVAVGTVPGTISDLLFNRALAREGITADGITTQYLPLVDIVAALANGRVDAGTLTDPLTTQAVQQGIGVVLYPAGVVVPGAILSVLQYSAAFAAEQPDAGVRFMVGYLQGVRDYHDAFVLGKDRDAAIATLVQSLSLKDPRIWEASHPATQDQNGMIDMAQLQDAAEYYLQRGDFSGPMPDLARYVDPRFAEAAVQILGRR